MGKTLNFVLGKTLNFVLGKTLNFVLGKTLNFVLGKTLNFVLGKTLNSSVVVLSTTLNSCGAIEEMIVWVLLQFAPLHRWFSFLVVPDLLCS